MKQLLAAAILPSRLSTTLGAVATAAMALHISAEVLSRLVWGQSLFGTIEIISYYYMVAASFLPLASAQLQGQMITTDVFAKIVPARIRPVTDFLGRLVSLATCGMLIWAGWVQALAKTRVNEAISGLGAPVLVWPSRWMLVIGLAALFLAQLVQLPRGVASDEDTPPGAGARG
ncbi:MAG: TRAP transporter small permease [Proteobacteria bacterium]|nr:TRAP transporter small permease [Pseudomonadota bacterium]